MSWGDSTGEFVTALIYVAILMVLVRPGSNGPAAISTVTGGMVNLVKAATGGGSLSGAASSSSTNTATIVGL